jgi:flagellar protein FlaG
MEGYEMINNVSGVSTSTANNADLTLKPVPSTQESNSAGNESKDTIVPAKDTNPNSKATGLQITSQTADKTAQAKLTASEESEKKKKNEMSKEEAVKMTDALNQMMGKMQFDVKFHYYDKIDQMAVQLVDQKTNKILKEFPPKDMIKMLTNLHNWIGIILDKRA